MIDEDTFFHLFDDWLAGIAAIAILLVIAIIGAGIWWLSANYPTVLFWLGIGLIGLITLTVFAALLGHLLRDMFGDQGHRA